MVGIKLKYSENNCFNSTLHFIELGIFLIKNFILQFDPLNNDLLRTTTTFSGPEGGRYTQVDCIRLSLSTQDLIMFQVQKYLR
jgi:hypothetical protein